MTMDRLIPEEVSTENSAETIEHYDEMVDGALDAASYDVDHPAVDQRVDNQDLMENLAAEMGDDIATLLSAGMPEEEAVATTAFYTGAAYGSAQDVEDVGGIAHGAVEVIPEHSDQYPGDVPPMEGQQYFESAAEDHEEVREEVL